MNSAHFYDFSIDRLRCVVQWREQPVPINRKTFDLLLYLIDDRDRMVTKDELLEKLWPDQFVEESNLTQHVFLLRKALSVHGADQKIIQTIPRRGYRFTAQLDEDEVPTERMVLRATESITRVTVEEEEEEEVALIQAQRVWLAAHPQSVGVLTVEYEIAMAEGRFRDAREIIERIREMRLQQVLSGPDDEPTKDAAVDLMESGNFDPGKKLFQQSPVDTNQHLEILGLAYIGDIDGALSALRSSET